MDSETLQQWTDQAIEFLALYGIRILVALLIFILGRIVTKGIVAVVRKIMKKSNMDDALVGFLGNILHMILLLVVIIAALDHLGIQTTSLVAVIGAAGLAVGLALQGSLSNFAAGVMIILFKPFKVGDFIDASGVAGIVEEINIFTTHLRTPDNKAVIVPNGQVTAGNITNFTAKETRRIDLVFGVSYADDIRKVKAVLEDELKKNAQVLEDPAPSVGLLELADSSVNFAVRPWVKTAEYWDVFFALQESIKLRLEAEGFTIPFPQQDVHMFQEK